MLQDPYEVCPASVYGAPHAWVAGMMVVHPEDLASVAAHREVECEGCEKVIGPIR